MANLSPPSEGFFFGKKLGKLLQKQKRVVIFKFKIKSYENKSNNTKRESR